MEQIIITSSSAQGLNTTLKKSIEDGFEPVGSHTCVELSHQPKYAGNQLMQTVIRVEYSQTIRRL